MVNPSLPYFPFLFGCCFSVRRCFSASLSHTFIFPFQCFAFFSCPSLYSLAFWRSSDFLFVFIALLICVCSKLPVLFRDLESNGSFYNLSVSNLMTTVPIIPKSLIVSIRGFMSSCFPCPFSSRCFVFPSFLFKEISLSPFLYFCSCSAVFLLPKSISLLLSFFLFWEEIFSLHYWYTFSLGIRISQHQSISVSSCRYILHCNHLYWKNCYLSRKSVYIKVSLFKLKKKT